MSFETPLPMSRKNELFKGGELIIDKCRLYSQNGASIDLTNHFESIDVYENIYENTLSGSITIVDGLNIAQHLPIMGQELLELTFYTPGLTKNKVKFIVNEISNRFSDKAQKMQKYTLNFVSMEAISNINKRVTKAYQGKNHETIEKILREYLTEEKQLFVEETLYTHKYVIPNWKPFTTINWLSSRSVAAKNPDVANYVFYETIDGFYFVSLSNIMSKPVVQEYRFDPAGTLDTKTGQRDILRELKNIEKYTIKPCANRSTQMTQGMFSGKITTHDLITKKIEHKEFNYNDHFDKTPSVEENKPISSLVALANSQESAFRRLYPKHTFKHDDIFDNEKSETFVLERNSLMSQLTNGPGINIIVPGDSRRRVGDIVDVKLPSPEPKNTLQKWYDMSTSGKYMITKIRHSMTNKNYKLFLELSRESSMTAMPDTKTTML